MHHGILSCSQDAPLEEVAAIMSEHGVHAVAVNDHEAARPVGIVSDMDVIGALASDSEPSALQAAATEALTVSAHESLHHAAQLMAEHGVSHLVVLDPAGGYPVGVLSTLDVAAAYVGVRFG